MLANVLVSAQNPIGPPDIAAEWRLDANERDLTSQAPLGDYSRNSVQRRGPDARRHVGRVDLGHARVSLPAALGSAPMARLRRRADHEGARSAHSRRHVVPRAVRRSLDRPIYLEGALTRPRIAAQLDGILDRRMARQHAGGDDHASQGRVLATRGPADERRLLDDGVPHAQRRHPDRHRHRRSHLQEEPYIHSTTYTYDPTSADKETCTARRSPKTAAPTGTSYRIFSRQEHRAGRMDHLGKSHRRRRPCAWSEDWVPGRRGAA